MQYSLKDWGLWFENYMVRMFKSYIFLHLRFATIWHLFYPVAVLENTMETDINVKEKNSKNHTFRETMIHKEKTKSCIVPHELREALLARSVGFTENYRWLLLSWCRPGRRFANWCKRFIRKILERSSQFRRVIFVRICPEFNSESSINMHRKSKSPIWSRLRKGLHGEANRISNVFTIL